MFYFSYINYIVITVLQAHLKKKDVNDGVNVFYCELYIVSSNFCRAFNFVKWKLKDEQGCLVTDQV